MIDLRGILRLLRVEEHMKPILTSLIAGSLFAALAMAQTPQYTVTDLGNLGDTSTLLDPTVVDEIKAGRV